MWVWLVSDYDVAQICNVIGASKILEHCCQTLLLNEGAWSRD